MEITIKGDDKKLLKLVEEVAKGLGLSVQKDKKNSSELSDKERSEKLYQLMTEMAASGGIKSIKDPVAWQREVREDKPLYGRE